VKRILEKGAKDMAKIETATFAQMENEVIKVPENYTQVTGIYTAQVTPQFLNGADNVQCDVAELLKAERAYVQQQELRFFRML
jgi:hypothetical protein